MKLQPEGGRCTRLVKHTKVVSTRVISLKCLTKICYDVFPIVARLFFFSCFPSHLSSAPYSPAPSLHVATQNPRPPSSSSSRHLTTNRALKMNLPSPNGGRVLRLLVRRSAFPMNASGCSGRFLLKHRQRFAWIPSPPPAPLPHHPVPGRRSVRE